MQTSPGVVEPFEGTRDLGTSPHRRSPDADAAPPRSAGSHTKMRQLWRRAYRVVAAGACGVMLQADVGCQTVFSQRFRDAALPEIESGINDILDGLVDGVFAAIETRSDSEE